MTRENSAEPTGAAPFRLANGTLLDPFISNILQQRGIIERSAIQAFLEPKLQHLPSPFLMKDMGKATNILEEAIREGQEIIIWGDYDVDGTTATALLLLFFRTLGCRASYYIPNRLTEGYGLNKKGLLKLAQESDSQRRVLITVDNGISAFDEIEYAQELGFSTIVTDHHIPPQERVQADAVLNAKQQLCDFPDKNLSGVGMAFYLAMGLRNLLTNKHFFQDVNKIPNLKMLLDLVAVGTVADMVPLVGINRLLVKAGMETIAAGTNPGLAALGQQSNIDNRHIRSEDISFQLAPKINASGRLGNAQQAVELFLSQNKKEAAMRANKLVEANKTRRNISLEQLQKAKNKIKKSAQDKNISLVVAGNFHVGVAGIIASSLTERYRKPSIILCEHEGGVLKGSARSVPGVNLHKALQECSEVLLGYGGHEMAGGMTLEADKLEPLKKLFEDAVYRQTQGQPYKKRIEADCDKQIKNFFTRNILDQLQLLEPFGEENPQLIIRDLDADIKQITAVGEDKRHLRFSFGNGNVRIDGIGFGLGNKIKEYSEAGTKEVLYTPTINFFNGQRKWQVRVSSVKVTKP